jgi:hypothetical protein
MGGVRSQKTDCSGESPSESTLPRLDKSVGVLGSGGLSRRDFCGVVGQAGVDTGGSSIEVSDSPLTIPADSGGPSRGAGGERGVGSCAIIMGLSADSP